MERGPEGSGVAQDQRGLPGHQVPPQTIPGQSGGSPSRGCHSARHPQPLHSKAWWACGRVREKLQQAPAHPSLQGALLQSLGASGKRSELCPWDVQTELGAGTSLRAFRQCGLRAKCPTGGPGDPRNLGASPPHTP